MKRYAILDIDGLVEGEEPTIERAIDEAQREGADHVVVDAAAEDEPVQNPPPQGRGALKQLLRPTTGKPLAIPDSAIEMDLTQAWKRLAALAPPFQQTGKTGIKRTFYPAKTRAALVDSFLGQNAKTEKKKGAAENVDVQGLSLVPYWMFAETPSPAGLGLTRHVPNLCAGSSPACRHSCLVFAGQNWAADWSIYSKFQKVQLLFADPEAFGRVLYASCERHLRLSAAGGRKGSKRKRFMPAVRLNVLSDIPWELVFPALFRALPDLQFYDYTKVHGRVPFPNYDLTFSNSGQNLRLVEQSLGAGTRVAVVAHVPKWKRGAPINKKPEESDRAYGRRKDAAVRDLWSDRLPSECGGYRVIDGDVNDVRFLDDAPSIVALRWKSPGGQAAARAPEALAISQRTKFVVEIEEFCGLTVGAVTPSEQPDTTIQTVFSLAPLQNPGRRVSGTRRAGYADPGTRSQLLQRLRNPW